MGGVQVQCVHEIQYIPSDLHKVLCALFFSFWLYNNISADLLDSVIRVRLRVVYWQSYDCAMCW